MDSELDGAQGPSGCEEDHNNNPDAIEQQGNSASEHNIGVNEHNHSSDSEQNLRKRPAHEPVEAGPSFKRERCEALSQDEQYNWQLPSELANYANKYFGKFVPEQSLKDSVLIDSPVPLNIAKQHKLDDYYRELLEERKARKDLNLEATFEKLQSKTRSIMGPLSKLWYCIEECLAMGHDETLLDLKELAHYTDQTVMLVGQAYNAITYNRRLSVLSAVQDRQKAKSILREQASLLEGSSNKELFGREFRDHIKETAKVKKECRDVYRKDSGNTQGTKYGSGRSFHYQARQQPFQRGPSFSRNGGRSNFANSKEIFKAGFNKGFKPFTGGRKNGKF